VFNAVQMGPHTILDEGIERTLDLLARTAATNVVMPYSHAYNAGLIKPLRDRADHGVPLTDNTGRRLPLVWVKTHDAYYRNTTLRHQVVDATFDHHNRDLFAELIAPARARGMKVYARVLESSAMSRSVANYAKVVTRDIHDKPTDVACWNHPEYVGFWADTMEDLFRSYDLDGIQWGAERQGSLMNVISPWNNNPPTCFCEHCRARGKAAGIDAERARKGFEDLFTYAQSQMSGKPRPADGMFVGFLRVMMRYPEILAWEREYRLGREAICDAMYRRVKSIKPTAEVGWHVDHQPSSWDLVYRAEVSYEDMAPHADFIKIIAYHNVLSPRIRDWYLPRFQKTILGEVSLKDSLNIYYAFFGYDRTAEPPLADLGRRGFSPEYVYRETKHSVASANGKTKIYVGIGFDVPGAPPDNPETVYRATLRAFDAGAQGVVASREYEEMKVANLAAVGRAVREAAKVALACLCLGVWAPFAGVLWAQSTVQTPAAQALPLVTPVDIQAAAAHMGATGPFASVRFRYATWPDHIDLTFDVTEAKWTVPGVFDNFVWFSDKELIAAVKQEVPSFDGTAPEAVGVTTLIQHALQAVLDKRKVPGQVSYMQAQVLGGGKPEHLFIVKAPGLKTCALRFDGASAVMARELQAASASLVGADYSRHAVGGYARATLMRVYRQHGYWRALVSDPVATLGGATCSGITVTLPVQEGVSYVWDRADWRGNRAVFQITLDEGLQFHMGTVTVVGLSAKDAESLQKRWKLKSGDVYDGSYLTAFYSREALQFKGSFKTVVPQLQLSGQIANVTIVFK
jgi:hypothetical protein